MALGTVTIRRRGVLGGGLRYIILEVQPTTGANYTANGETLALSQFKGFKKAVLFAACEPKDEASSAREFTLDIPNMKLVVMDAATAAEVAGSSDQSAFRTVIFAIGR